MKKNNISIVEIFSILVKWRKIIVINFLLFSIVSAGISLLLPKWYTSTCTLLPPEQQSMGGLDLMSMLGDMPISLPSFPGLTGPSDVYIAILRSRNVREKIVTDLGLQELYGTTTMIDALAILDGLTKIDKSEENIISISTTAKTKSLAVAMAKLYVENLDRVNLTTKITSAKYARVFIEKRLKKVNLDLEQAAVNLRDFQKKHNFISVEEQTKAAIEAAAKIEAEIALVEIENNIARSSMASSHPLVKTLDLRLKELKKQVAKIETGKNLDENSYVIPFEKLPDLGMQYSFLLRDVEVQKAIYKLMVQQHEQAKIQEAKDTPTVQILDHPIEPEKRSKPKRTVIVIISAILSIFVSFFVIFFIEYLKYLRDNDPLVYKQLKLSFDTLLGDLRLFRKKRV